MKNPEKRIGIVVLAFSLLVSLLANASTVLIRDGQPLAAVILAKDPLPLESRAASEIVEHLRLMTGAELPVVTATNIPKKHLPVFLGQAADPAMDAITCTVRANPSAFTLRISKDRIDVRGSSAEGTLFGTYELLEQLGFRWYLPGDFGRVVPKGETVSFSRQTITQTPSMAYRHLQHLPNIPWFYRARLGGDVRSTGRHGIPGLPRNAKAFETDPEMFSLVNGVRRARQDCLSNPKVLAQAIEGVRTEAARQGGDIQYVGAASHDGGGYCECDGCRALDQGVYDPTGDRESMTDRYIWFFNRILEALELEFPNLHIVHYTYAAHMMPPAIEINPRIVPVFAPITLDRVRGMDNPMSPDRHLLRWLIDAYAKRGVNEMYYRGYYHNLACPQFPFSQLDRIEHETRAFARKGISAMRVENIYSSWSSAFLDLYLATRMMWNVDTDVPALLDEFYRLYYGPAEAPMRAYHEGLEAAFRDTPYFTGSSYLYLPIFLEHPRRDALRTLLDEARKIVGEPSTDWIERWPDRHPGDTDFALRVASVRFNWDRMDLFLNMMEARNRHDFATVHAIMEGFDRLTARATQMAPFEVPWGPRPNPGRYNNPRLVYQRESSGGGYFNRFFRRPMVSGFQRTVEIGEIVAPLADEWLFLLDPSEIGEISGWQRPGDLGGNWQPIKTSSRSWSDQGLHYYKGVAWYRQKVVIPAGFQGRPVYLWFGGVDRLASVWINGHFMGTSREPREGIPGVPGSFRPFDMPTTTEDGTSALDFGRENWVVVRIENKDLAELGTGGIIAPVMFWAPADPEWAP